MVSSSSAYEHPRFSLCFCLFGAVGEESLTYEAFPLNELMAACYRTIRETEAKINKRCSISWWLFLGEFFLVVFSVHTAAASLK